MKYVSSDNKPLLSVECVEYEFEQTWTPKAIFEERIRLNEKITSFMKYGLSKQIKFLYVFTTENFDVTTRSVAYGECKPMTQV